MKTISNENKFKYALISSKSNIISHLIPKKNKSRKQNKNTPNKKASVLRTSSEAVFLPEGINECQDHSGFRC